MIPLLDAASAVLRDAMDNVRVHPCGENDDAVRARGLYGPMADLYAALAAATAPQPVADSNSVEFAGIRICQLEQDDGRAVFEAWVSAGGRAHMLGRDGGHQWYKDLTVAGWREDFQFGRAQSARQIATLHAVIADLTAEREGWQWVPKEPTEAMVQAACAARGAPHMIHVIKAAIAAAPASPTGSGE
jgi:hypothetical protein